MSFIDPVLDSIDAIMNWMGSAVGQTTESYCELETADNRHTLVARDGSLVSLIEVHGATQLVGPEEFDRMQNGLYNSMSAALARRGHAIQVYYYYDRETIEEDLRGILGPSIETARRMSMDLDDLFKERITNVGRYCATERCFFVVWTRPSSVSEDVLKMYQKEKNEELKKHKIPPMFEAQNIFSAVTALRENHDSFVKTLLGDMQSLKMHAVLTDVHTAVWHVRNCIDPDVTSRDWRAVLPGDRVSLREKKKYLPKLDISHVMFPPLHLQVIPRDAENMDLRTCRIGDRIYASLYIDLFPQQQQSFHELFNKIRYLRMPWRMSFMIESDGLRTLGIKPLLASILSFASSDNVLISDAAEVLRNIETNTDIPVIKLRVSFSTWAPADQASLVRKRAAELTKAVQGWGQCEVAEISGDAFAATLSSALAVTTQPIGTATIAPLDAVTYMLPFSRPASIWQQGAVLLRSPDGKPWPYQPGSTQQTTWIDLVYARPGSGKSVLSNSINLGLCIQGGIQRLPRIAIIDIGPSSSGLISLLREALPKDKMHLAAYHRLRMTPDYSINPFDTQLGCRKPTPAERSFLVNFITLLATPVGESKPYDGIADMAGMVVDELYKHLSDKGGNPHRYTRDIERRVDEALDKISFYPDMHTSWWEVVDALFEKNLVNEAIMAQRYCMPLMADAVAICRQQTVEDLYGQITAPTGENLIAAFGRMISSAVREYPTLSRVTQFDLGDARVVSLDLDEVAKTGGESADRQTAVMYMLARYVLARHYYLTEETLEDFPQLYREYHRKRIIEIREDAKRIVFDEFHRTSKAQAVRDQVIVDMREGRKWKVQVALLSQSLDDFDKVMVEFGTSVFIMDAGPKQAVEQSVRTFGLSPTAENALMNRVHGPRSEGATFLAQFSTKNGISTQLCTSTLGPIELWAFNTTAEDARIRNALYQKIGAKEARTMLAMLYPNGSAAKMVEERLLQKRATGGKTDFVEEDAGGVINEIVEEIMEVYRSMPNMSHIDEEQEAS